MKLANLLISECSLVPRLFDALRVEGTKRAGVLGEADLNVYIIPIQLTILTCHSLLTEVNQSFFLAA